MTIFIKSMVSQRCTMFVTEVLKQLNIQYNEIKLGRIELSSPITPEQQSLISVALYGSGLEIIEGSKEVLVEKIKIAVLSLIDHGEQMTDTRNSHYISRQLGYDYTYLANIFSQYTGNTIEQYIITSKVEKVKELLTNNELSLTEISYKLNYCSVAYLSAQFKKITGTTASCFKKQCHLGVGISNV